MSKDLEISAMQMGKVHIKADDVPKVIAAFRENWPEIEGDDIEIPIHDFINYAIEMGLVYFDPNGEYEAENDEAPKESDYLNGDVF